jgi:DNA repair exonuclease SbcCD ATPase subunit
MLDGDKYFIKRVKITGLFGRDQPIVLDFGEGINCIYGANGSGKTTVINALVAALSSDVKRFLAARCESLTVFVSKTGKKRLIKFFTVGKEVNDQGVRDRIGYVFSNEFDPDSLGTSPTEGDTKRLISKFLSVNYLPLYRYNASEFPERERSELRMSRGLSGVWRGDEEEVDTSLDPVRRMLFGLENRFKDQYAQKQRAIRNDLESLKNKVLEKLLIDDALVSKAKISVLRKSDITTDDYKQAQQKLDDIGLRLPSDKLEKHFAAMIKASQEVSAKRDEYMAYKTSGSPDPKKVDILLDEYGVTLRVYRALDTTHSRLMSVISDVEKSTEYRLEALKGFKQFQDMINTFFVNKTFEFSEAGEFKFICRGTEIKVEELSSGEKHVLALLGKVALSPVDKSVFIADEPELSLHLSWQRKLLPALHKIAPATQIIVATHAPAMIPATATKIDLDEINHGAAAV